MMWVIPVSIYQREVDYTFWSAPNGLFLRFCTKIHLELFYFSSEQGMFVLAATPSARGPLLLLLLCFHY